MFLVDFMDWAVYAALAVFGGFIVGNLIHNFVGFVSDAIRKQDRD